MTIDSKQSYDLFELEWIDESALVESTKYVDHYHLDSGMKVTIDGKSGIGIIQKPITKEKESMDEEESSGI